MKEPITTEEVGDFVAKLHAETPAPLNEIITEVTDGLAFSSERVTDGTEDKS